jgi:gamma-glutamyltranspeptidase/glutathione hydrolase
VASRSGIRYFLKKGGRAYAIGDLFKQPELAYLLRRLADDGPEAFYTGETARLIDADMRTHGGFLRAGDLAPIPWPVERPVLTTTYRDLAMVSGPPPAAGRSLFALLKGLEKYPGDYLTGGSPRAAWDLAQVIQKVLIRRRATPIAPDRYDPNQDPLLMSPNCWEPPVKGPQGLGDGGGQTTHISAMDRWGNAVGITQSVNLVYASKAAAGGLGFLYNNYLLDCDKTNPDHPNFLRPGGMPASFVAPLIVLSEGEPWLVTGSPGSERILSTVAQFLIHLVDGGQPMGQAMHHPRLHYSPEGILSIEAGRFEKKVVDYLRQRAGKLSVRRDYSFYLGAIHSVLRCRSACGFQGVAELRRDGVASGY